MRAYLLFGWAALLFFWAGCTPNQPAGAAFIPYVDPLIGTAPSTTPSAISHSEAASELNAQVFPATGVPFGMTQWTPQTRATERKCVAPYYYRDKKLQGFRGSHWMSGSCTQDYGSMTVMAMTGGLKTDPESWASTFIHEEEISSPNYYAVSLADYGIRAELSGSCRSGFIQLTCERKDTVWLVFMPNSDEGEGTAKIDRQKGVISVQNPVHRIYQGWGEPAGFSGFFHATLDTKFEEYGGWIADEIMPGQTEAKGAKSGVYLKIPVEQGQVIKIKIGSSFTDAFHASLNLLKEIPHWQFDKVVQQAGQAWAEALGTLRVKSGTPDQKTIFYTALYHASLLPRVFSDVDGSYPVFAGGKPIQQAEIDYYADFSMWDTYRALHPLLGLLQPARTRHMMQSLLLKAKQGDWLPIFPAWNSYTAAMIGDHVSATLADAYVKDIWTEGSAEAYTYMKKNATQSPPTFEEYEDGKGRRALISYLKYGYVPLEDSVWESFHKREQVSRTLEYAYDDFALAQMAKKMGRTEDYETFILRALNYQHVVDTSVGFVRGKYANGQWIDAFDPRVKPPYITEGTPWHYSWYVPHDPYGLIQLMGGPRQVMARLDTLFEEDLYWHGNEPGHQIPYMYVYTGRPWKTQKWVDVIRKTEYDTGPGGLTGNDDAGQMSAWYIFSALGFYPVCPASPYYIIGTPLFEEVEMHLENGKAFTISAENADENNPYIQSAEMNGEPFNRSWLSHAEILAGGQLTFVMGPRPNPAWGNAENLPPDLMVLEE